MDDKSLEILEFPRIRSCLDTTHFILEDIGRKATGKEVRELSRIQKEDLVLVEGPR